MLFQCQHTRPLTRYLPVRQEHFDLRAHVESAGHQIELCSRHLVINSGSCRGYLYKKATGGAGKMMAGRQWNRRWFVFDRHRRALLYYSDKTESKAKGGIYFQVSFLIKLCDFAGGHSLFMMHIELHRKITKLCVSLSLSDSP